MNIAFMTHRGAVRPANQDALQIADRTFAGDMDVPESLEITALPLLVSVVDGLGGYNGGERAAEILSDVLAQGAVGFGPELDPEADRQHLHSLLTEAIARMNADARQKPEFAGMGATVAGLLFRERSVLAFNCGDCRAYRFSGGEPEKLTHDHSVVQQLFDDEEISEEEMRTHPRKNIVTSAVATGDPSGFELCVRPVSRAQGDAFFICSDGVWEALPLRDLARCFGSASPDAPQKLFDALLEAKCGDNVSFIWMRPM